MSEQHLRAAEKRGAARTADLERRVLEAIQTIQAEMNANGGIYPHNGGAVSMAELVRRADIDESSLYKKIPANEALKKKAAEWLKTLRKKETVGRTRVRRTFAQRAEDWKTKHDALQQRHIKTELELQSLQAEMEKLRKTNAGLLEQLQAASSSKVTPIPKRK